MPRKISPEISETIAASESSGNIHRRQGPASHQLKVSPSADGYLTITKIRCKGLIPCDSSGLSDPFVEITVHRTGLLQRSLTWRSPVQRQTLNPEWNATGRFDGTLEDLMTHRISLHVWDHAAPFKTKSLGSVNVDITRLPFTPSFDFVDVPLEHVEHGLVSYRVAFHLSPQRWAFPAMPLHASALLALRRTPPSDATRYELFRDACLRGLTHWSFRYIAITWVLLLVGWGIFVVYLYVLYAALQIEAGEGGAVNASAAEASATDETAGEGTSEDAQAALKKIAEVEVWINICMQVFTGLFSYLNLLTMPWRLSIAIHHWHPHRSSKPGHDFYGRDTDALWFHTPPRGRSAICALLLLSLLFHYATQACRLVWSDYASSNDFTRGGAPVNITFVLSILCGIAAGVIQGGLEKRIRKAEPGRFPPDPAEALSLAYSKWRAGDSIGHSLVEGVSEYRDEMSKRMVLEATRSRANLFGGLGRSAGGFDPAAPSAAPEDEEEELRLRSNTLRSASSTRVGRIAAAAKRHLSIRMRPTSQSGSSNSMSDSMSSSSSGGALMQPQPKAAAVSKEEGTTTCTTRNQMDGRISPNIIARFPSYEIHA